MYCCVEEWPKESSWEMQFLGKLFIQVWEMGWYLYMCREHLNTLFLFLPVTASKCKKEHATVSTLGLNIATQGQYN